jgi:hypothetical protein
MKKTLLLIGILLTLNSCEKKDDPTLTPIEQLPKATKTGANTAGCLVNGEAFLPKGFSPSGNLRCFYINQNTFTLSISDIGSNRTNSVYIETNNEELEVNKIYNLNQLRSSNDSKFAEYIIFRDNGNDEKYTTTPNITGELVITHHDYNNAIISGTFWFDAVNNIEEKVEVREGRFDMKY